MTNDMRKVAVIGCGPRGLAAIECLFVELEQSTDTPNIEIEVFDPAENPGAGSVWRVRQSDANWLNISERALENLDSRPELTFKQFTIPGFQSYSEWVKSYDLEKKKNKSVDHYPPRSKMGSYLSGRYESIVGVLESKGMLSYHDTEVESVRYDEGIFTIRDEEGGSYKSEECLIAIGHQPTKKSDEIKEWIEFSKNRGFQMFTNPYNERLYFEINKDEVVGLRGFGLAMIDVVRLLTVEKGAKFEKHHVSDFLKYQPSDKSIRTIIPFSLDGLPPVPKPLGAHLDNYFKPTQKQKEEFVRNIRQAIQNGQKIESKNFLVEIFAEIAASVFLHLDEMRIDCYLSTKQLVDLISQWLDDMNTEHRLILDNSLYALDYMKVTSEMALGHQKFSLDYCVGQVWRHLQPLMYKEFSHSNLEDRVVKEIIQLDESTKRYSYGPPVESVLQLIALAEAGVLDLTFVRNPEISLTDHGWGFYKNNIFSHVTTMVDTVLDAPNLSKTDSDIMKCLLEDDAINLVSSDLGVKTNKDATVVSKHEDQNFNLAVVGRNSKGSVIGVDAILECFGTRIHEWAVGVCKRL